VGIGASAPTVALDVYSGTAASAIRNSVSGAFNASIINQRSSDDTSGPLTISRKTRGTTASPTAVQSGDTIGTIIFDANDGSTVRQAATIVGAVDGAVSSAVVPGRLIFNTTSSAGTLTERMRIDSAGNVGIGSAAGGDSNFSVSSNLTGATTVYGIRHFGTIQSGATANTHVISAQPSTAAAAFTATKVNNFTAFGGTIGATSAITTQVGFFAASSLTVATNNYAFQGSIAAAANRWNLYMDGTAANYMAGRLGVGATLTTGAMAQVTNTTAADKAFVVKGAASQTGDLLDVQNSAGTSLAVINSAGRFVVGNSTTATTYQGAIPSIQSLGTGASASSYLAGRYSADANGPAYYLTKSRSATIGSESAVSTGDRLGNVYFSGSDGTNQILGVSVAAEVDGTVSTGVVPGRIIFFTSSSAGAATERMRIDSAGNLLVGMTTIATSSAKTIHLANATVPTANPTGGGVLYVESGALKYRGSSGTVTTLGNA
jgi:hypothetical protein